MTRKMLGVIYRTFKEGKLTETTNEDINNMYYWEKQFNNAPNCFTAKKYHADEYEEFLELKNAVDAIFKGDYKTAEKYTKGFAPVC